jgi:phosphohistidine phosphatase
MTARTLLVVRHAKSDWDTPAPDNERPINARGRREAPRLGRMLNEAGLRPDRVVCSAATRAQQTWRLASAAWSDPPPMVVEPRLYDASRSEVLAVINETGDDVSVLACVGHEPTSSALVSVLAGSADAEAAATLSAGLKTACAAVLTFDGRWSDLEPGLAHLARVVSPR